MTKSSIFYKFFSFIKDFFFQSFILFIAHLLRLDQLEHGKYRFSALEATFSKFSRFSWRENLVGIGMGFYDIITIGAIPFIINIYFYRFLKGDNTKAAITNILLMTEFNTFYLLRLYYYQNRQFALPLNEVLNVNIILDVPLLLTMILFLVMKKIQESRNLRGIAY